MGILNVGTQALQANQVALQTVGNNIANVNTTGYSRQNAILQTVPGQFTGGGYIGKGVNVQTIQRNFSEFLTRQANLASSTQSADLMRADKLKQMEGIFEGGAQGLGASISDMLNAFSDVAGAPTDLTARTVVLTRIDETAARLRSSQQRLDDLQSGVVQELNQKVDSINGLARSIAEINQEIARTKGNGQPPNDLLDRRDQLVRELGTFVQTTTIPADDGTLGVFIGGSQSLVLGTLVSTVSIVKDEFADQLKSKLAVSRNGTTVVMDEDVLGGGQIAGLLRFQNNDLIEGRNLLGRLTLGVTSAMNDQHKLGLDLDGNAGGNIFSPTIFGANNVLASSKNSSVSNLSLAVTDVTRFAASDYEILFSSGTNGTVTRKSDGQVTNFTFAAGAGTFQFQTLGDPAAGPYTGSSLDGIALSASAASAPSNGDRFLVKPFSTSASNISSVFSTPRALAVASPIAGAMGLTNTGSLQQVSLTTRSNPATNVPATFTFTSATTYTRSDEVPANATTFNYVPGQAIEGSTPATTPLSNWSLVLQGSPRAGDTFTVAANAYPNLSAGNASAMLNLRDLAMFDGAALTDGYAGLISQIGIRTQSANYAADVSTSIAANIEKDRAGVSGVNLDEEAAKLLQYQQAYQASAKMVQIAQSIFESLLQGLGR